MLNTEFIPASLIFEPLLQIKIFADLIHYFAATLQPSGRGLPAVFKPEMLGFAEKMIFDIYSDQERMHPLLV